MADLTLGEAEAILRQDGRFGWLLSSGKQAWSVNEVAREYAIATGVSVSHDTVTRWFKRLPSGKAENYGGHIGWRAQRDALIIFFAQGGQFRGADGSAASEETAI